MKIASVMLDEVRLLAFQGGDGSWRLVNSSNQPHYLRSLKALICYGQMVVESELLPFSELVVEDQLQFLPPVISPEKIICVGKNYEEHAREMGGETPELPVIFNKLASCLVGDGQEIVLPAISSKVDYEGELVVVIGREGRNVSRENALEHVFGYTVGNDVSARDWQKGRPGGQWLLGKSFDTFAPLGPWIVTADEITDPQDLDLELRLNGNVMQSSNTSKMIFPVDHLIWHVSQFFTLKPGDLIFTGTPAGVGAGREPEVYLKSGDTVCVRIESIGELTNPVV